MNEPTTPNASRQEDFDKLQKRLDTLRKESVFLRLPNVAVSICMGITWGCLAYVPTSNLPTALLIGIIASIATLALNESAHLRQHTDTLLSVIDALIAASRRNDSR